MKHTNQIYEMTRGIAELLDARKFSNFAVHYGPSIQHRSSCHTHIEVLRDTSAGDTTRASQGTHQDKKVHRVRTIGVVVHILAASTLPNARHIEHEALADALADGFETAYFRWASEARAVGADVVGGRFLKPEEVKQSFETWPGVVYQIKLRVPRSVSEVTYEGEGRPTAVVSKRKNTTKTSSPGRPEVTGCGA